MITDAYTGVGQTDLRFLMKGGDSDIAATKHDLIDEQTAKWHEALLRAIFTTPMRYADRRTLQNTAEFEEGTKVNVRGIVTSKKVVHGRRGAFLDIRLKDDTGHEFQVMWFNFRAYQEKIFEVASSHVLCGKPKRMNQTWTFFNPEIVNPSSMGGIEPIYRKEGKEKSEAVKKRVRLILKESARFIPGLFPSDLVPLLQEMKLPALMDAIRNTHWPKDLEDAYRAHETLKVAEIIWQMDILSNPENGRVTGDRPALKLTEGTHGHLLEALPFTLSPSQVRAWDGLKICFTRPQAQDILILGGVGSGKSAIAFLAALAQASSVQTPNRALLVAPTVILASQLHENLSSVAKSLGLDVALYGRDKYTPDSAVRLWVGTYGLLKATKDWDNVGLVVMDEEHRYGKDIKNLPAHVHRILMSATPIPNTLAQQRFGAMHLFRLRNDHHQRDVTSKVIPRNKPHAAIQQLRETLQKGRKGLVVYAAVQERDAIKLPEHFYFMSTQIPGDYAIAVETRKISPELGTKEEIETGKLAKLLLPHCEQKANREPHTVKRFYRLTKDFSAKKLLEGEIQLDLLDDEILLYDKDQPDRFFKAPLKWLRKGTSGAMSTKAILNACRSDALESVTMLRSSQLLQGKSLESARAYWDKQFPGQTTFLHGKMTDTEKTEALNSFRTGSTPLLIASNIVEVGIDVQGADTVVVADADRMGVASLVQIRGRVGRHGEPGYCYFIGADSNEEGLERLERIANEDNDEKLAIQDFLERGFGSVGNTSQSGNTGRLFRLPRDAKLFLKVAKARSTVGVNAVRPDQPAA